VIRDWWFGKKCNIVDKMILGYLLRRGRLSRRFSQNCIGSKSAIAFLIDTNRKIGLFTGVVSRFFGTGMVFDCSFWREIAYLVFPFRSGTISSEI